MSDQYIDIDTDEYLDTPKALRDAYKKLAADHKKAIEERDTYKGRAETSALGDVLKGFVKPERVKSALLSDKVDPLDSEAVAAWVAENGDDFAKGDATPTPSTPPADEAEADAHRRLQASGDLTQPADLNKFEAAFLEIPENATAEQVRDHFVRKGL